jgi:hypothetical protein
MDLKNQKTNGDRLVDQSRKEDPNEIFIGDAEGFWAIAKSQEVP